MFMSKFTQMQICRLWILCNHLHVFAPGYSWFNARKAPPPPKKKKQDYNYGIFHEQRHFLSRPSYIVFSIRSIVLQSAQLGFVPAPSVASASKAVDCAVISTRGNMTTQQHKLLPQPAPGPPPWLHCPSSALLRRVSVRPVPVCVKAHGDRRV